MPQAARNWAETGALLCEVLAAELEGCRGGSLPQMGKEAGSSPCSAAAALPEQMCSEDMHGQQACTEWPQISPAESGAQRESASIPEPPAELAAVLGATWHALLPEKACSSSAAVRPVSTPAAMQGSTPYVGSSCQLESSEQGTPYKRFKESTDSAGIVSHAAGEADGSSGAADDHHVGPEGLGLDFRILGWPAGLAVCDKQPSSRPELLAALRSELPMSGLSLLSDVRCSGVGATLALHEWSLC